MTQINVNLEANYYYHQWHNHICHIADQGYYLPYSPLYDTLWISRTFCLSYDLAKRIRRLFFDYCFNKQGINYETNV